MATQTDLLGGREMSAWVLRFAARVVRDVNILTELDRLAGDGDFGWNIRTALERASRAILPLSPDSPTEPLRAASEAFLGAGGTSGALYGLWFGRLAHGEPQPWTTRDLAVAVVDATEAVQRLGGASVGHKTMVDAMVPAAGSLTRDVDLPWRTATGNAARAAGIGAASTEEIVAARGRASYLGERARGVVDPGALAVAWFFEAATPIGGAGI